MFISNAIYCGEQSLKWPSAISQLILLVLSYHLSTILALAITFDASNFTCRTSYEPLPSVEGCGLLHTASALPHKRECTAPPLSKGMWVA
jgi:hypothetical protein